MVYGNYVVITNIGNKLYTGKTINKLQYIGTYSVSSDSTAERIENMCGVSVNKYLVLALHRSTAVLSPSGLIYGNLHGASD
jgi:hypothetical protein